MAAPKGEYTPQSGPLAGRTYGTYYQYQVARAQMLYGTRGYAGERAIKAVAPNEAMGRVVIATTQAGGGTRAQAIQEYSRLRAANGGKQPTRNQITKRLRDAGIIDDTQEPDWDKAS